TSILENLVESVKQCEVIKIIRYPGAMK
uniref:Uncharacterized protein n=1 Tax=Ditylenchus dipsaci TaxID=166011 RepID=A0A915EBD4_9BILA